MHAKLVKKALIFYVLKHEILSFIQNYFVFIRKLLTFVAKSRNIDFKIGRNTESFLTHTLYNANYHS